MNISILGLFDTPQVINAIIEGFRVPNEFPEFV